MILIQANIDMKIVLRLEKSSGLADFVIWNPWIEGAAKMGDMDDDEWRNFVVRISPRHLWIFPKKGLHRFWTIWKV